MRIVTGQWIKSAGKMSRSWTYAARRKSGGSLGCDERDASRKKGN